MDELAYHASRQARNPSPCVFERAILAGCVQCELARRQALAEREIVACSLTVARINCATLAALLHERATFVLRIHPSNEPLAHAKVMKLQCGGLRGLQDALGAPTADVHAMVQQAKANSASLLDLPWNQIVASIGAWQLRHRPPTPGTDL